jgi:hypothetical protein
MGGRFSLSFWFEFIEAHSKEWNDRLSLKGPKILERDWLFQSARSHGSESDPIRFSLIPFFRVLDHMFQISSDMLHVSRWTSNSWVRDSASIKSSTSLNLLLQSYILLCHQGLLRGLSKIVTQQSRAHNSEVTKISQGEDGMTNLMPITYKNWVVGLRIRR